MEFRLPPGRNGNADAVGEGHGGVPVFLNVVDVDEKGLMDWVEKPLGQLGANVIVAHPKVQGTILGEKPHVPAAAGQVEDVVHQHPPDQVAAGEVQVDLGAVQVFHGLVQTAAEPLLGEGLGEKTESLQVHGIVLISVEIGDEEKNEFFVLLPEGFSHGNAVLFANLNVQKRHVEPAVGGEGLSGVRAEGDDAGQMMLRHVGGNAVIKGLQIDRIIVAEENVHVHLSFL